MKPAPAPACPGAGASFALFEQFGDGDGRRAIIDADRHGDGKRVDDGCVAVLVAVDGRCALLRVSLLDHR